MVSLTLESKSYHRLVSTIERSRLTDIEHILVLISGEGSGRRVENERYKLLGIK